MIYCLISQACTSETMDVVGISLLIVGSIGLVTIAITTLLSLRNKK